MSKIVFDFAASEGNTCVLVSAQVSHSNKRNSFCTVLLRYGQQDNFQACITRVGILHMFSPSDTLSFRLSPSWQV
jgi:hypothetical protein